MQGLRHLPWWKRLHPLLRLSLHQPSPLRRPMRLRRVLLLPKLLVRVAIMGGRPTNRAQRVRKTA